MSGRDIALCLFCGLAVTSAAGIRCALAALRRWEESPGIAVILTGAAVLCGMYAVMGWGWWLATGVLR